MKMNSMESYPWADFRRLRLHTQGLNGVPLHTERVKI